MLLAGLRRAVRGPASGNGIEALSAIGARRYLAKGKNKKAKKKKGGKGGGDAADKKKGGGKGGAGAEEEEEFDLDAMVERMGGAVKHFEKQLQGIRGGRTDPGMPWLEEEEERERDRENERGCGGRWRERERESGETERERQRDREVDAERYEGVQGREEGR